MDTRIGTTIDGVYELIRPIGRGGSAVVYKALDHVHREHVALKVVTMDVPDRATIHARFYKELLLSTRVRHDHLVHVLDFGATEWGAPYLAMELLEGRSLYHHLHRRGGAIPETTAVPLFLALLDGFRVAHARGVVHSDIKPANLFLCRQEGGVALVALDFGIASRRDNLGAYIGTPRYSAPETILTGAVSPAVDVYQLALVLCEMITGVPVVRDRDQNACLDRHAQGRVRLPRALEPSVLAPVLRRALAFSPRARPKDAGAFRDALFRVTRPRRRAAG